jgi:NADPH:quinone reductase-like Zn-dependent oxidoreductase
MPATAPPETTETTEAAAALAATMSAVQADRYGAPGEVLGVRTLERPVPGKGEVLVQVVAAGLSRAALHLTTGTPYLLRLAGFGLRAPKHPVGIEAAGTVVAVGPGVTRFAVGDEVFGYAKGSCAEFAVAKADKLAHRPDGLTAVEAAALVDSASTALQAVRDHGGVRAGQRVLVLGASGGVGSFAVQVAAALGAEVTGTASTAKVDFVRGLGATDVVDHTTADPLATEAPFDVILDLGGNRPVKAMLRALTLDGTLVIVGGEGGGKLTGGFQRQLLAPIRAVGGEQSVTTFVANEHHRFLDHLAAMAVAGQIRPAIDQTHPLDGAGRGLERMETGAIRGKDVVEVRRTADR